RQAEGCADVPRHPDARRVRVVQVTLDDGRLPPQEGGSRPHRAAHREHARVRGRAGDSGRSGDRARRREPRPRGARRHPAQVPARPAAARPVRALDRARAARGSRRRPAAALGRAYDRLSSADYARDRAPEPPGLDRRRHTGGGDRRRPARETRGLRGHGRRADRIERAALLARAALHHLVRRRPSLAAGERLRDDSPSAREPRAHGDARDRARHRLRGGADAPDALLDAHLTWSGLRADGPGQGPQRVVGRRAARPAKQPDHGYDARRVAARRAHLGRRGHGDDLRHRRLRTADDRRGKPARLRPHPGRRPRHCGRVRRRQPPGRRRLLAAQPADPRVVSAVDTATMTSPRTRRRVLLRKRFLRRPMAVAGLVVVVAFVVVAIFAPWLAPYRAGATDFNALLAQPSSKHLLGTDSLGRDELSRLIWGARASMQAGFFATVLAILVATPIGMIAGYYRGWVDSVIARLTDVLLAFPFLILAVGLAAIFGASLLNATLALGVGAAPGLIRVARGETLALREEDYVPAAIANGATDRTIIFRHILPNMTSTLLVQATVTIPAAI